MKFNDLRKIPITATCVVTVATFAGILLGKELPKSTAPNNSKDLPILSPTEDKKPSQNDSKIIDLVSYAFSKSHTITGDLSVILNGSLSRGEDYQEIKTTLINFQRLQDLGLIPKNALEVYKQKKMLGIINADNLANYKEAVSAWYNITNAVNAKKITYNDVNLILRNSDAKDLLLNGIIENTKSIDYTSFPLSIGAIAWLTQIQSEYLNKLLIKLA